MANSFRRNIVRSMNGKIMMIEECRDHFIMIANLYKADHPEYFDMFMRLADYLDKFLDPAKSIRDSI